MGSKRILRHQLVGNLKREIRFDTALNINLREFRTFELGLRFKLPTFSNQVGVLCIDCELIDTYSPAAIDIALATSPAMPATSTSELPQKPMQRR
jgi:hypothetical protein